MRISDWSSDVCSSDLAGQVWVGGTLWLLRVLCGLGYRELGLEHLPKGPALIAPQHQSAWETDRKSVVSGKSVSVHVDLVGRRLIKKQKLTKRKRGTCKRKNKTQTNTIRYTTYR